MSGVRISEEEERTSLRDFNKTFHGRALLDHRFYGQLMQAGFLYQRCILLEVWPDGGDTYVGTIIDQNGDMYKFDMDLDDDQHSVFELLPMRRASLEKMPKLSKKWKTERSKSSKSGKLNNGGDVEKTAFGMAAKGCAKRPTMTMIWKSGGNQNDS